MLTSRQTQQLDQLLSTVNEMTSNSISDWHQTLADEVRTAVASIEQMTVAASQASLVQQMSQMFDRQEQAILQTLDLPLRTLQKLVDSGHLDESQKTKLLFQLGGIYEQLTQWDTALDQYYRSLDYCQADSLKKADVLKRIGRIKSKQRDYSASNSLYRDSLALYLELQNQHQASQLYVCMGWNDFQSDNYQLAEANYQRGLKLAESLDDAKYLIADVRMNMAILDTVRGQFHTALSHYEESVAAYELINDDRGLAQVHYNMGLLYVDIEAWQKAGESYQKSLELAQKQSNLYIMGHVYLSYTELALKLSDLELAQASCMHAIKIFGRLGSQPQLAEAYKYAGQIQHRRKAFEKSERFFQKSVELAEACDSRLNQAEAHYEYGLTFVAKSDRDNAQVQLNEALHIFTALGAQADVERTQAALAQVAETQPEAAPSSRFKRIKR